MGGADIIPGVSGGTVALIVGIYERLVTAISHFDMTLVAHLRHRRWQLAAQHIDLRFLVALGIGILLGVVSLGSLMNHLLTSDMRSFTLAALFGAILSTCWLVGKLVRPCHALETIFCLVGAIAATALTFWISSATTKHIEPSHGFLFFCGMIGICAMILPGISGALILLVLGVYVYLTDYLKALLHGNLSGEAITTVMIFGSGCAIGLLVFSKFLRWLLEHYKSVTMAVMCGFMLGALKKIWPFQTDLTPQIEEIKHKTYQLTMPTTVDQHVILCVLSAVFGFIAILGLDWASRKLMLPVESVGDRSDVQEKNR